MKVTGYRLETYRMRLDRPIADANLPSGVEVVPGAILMLETDVGATGISLGYGGASLPLLFDAIEGADPRETASLWRRMNDLLHKAGNRGEASMALSAIDLALWDLKAKLAGQPLWRLLGAHDRRVPAYASGLDYCLSDDELFAFYRGMAERGIRGGKLKVGLDLAADLRRIGIMREALGAATPSPLLMIDCNEYWSPRQAIRYVHAIEQHYDLAWIEEPARRWDYDGLRLVSRHVAASVSTGENLTSLADFHPLITRGAVDVVSLSSIHSGVTGCRQVAHLADVHALPVSMMNCQANFMAHVAAALPNHAMMEVVECGREHCLRYDNRIEDGCVVLGDAPGFGLEVDEVRLSALQADPPVGRGRFPFPRRAGAALHPVPPAPGEVPWRRGP